MDSYKKNIADGFSKESEFWKVIYDPTQDGIDHTFSSEMIRRKEKVIQLFNEYRSSEHLKVLDAGCGAGVFMRDLMNTGHDVCGIDHSLGMLSTAREILGDVSNSSSLLCNADIENLPFHDCSFDAVICVGVLSYLKEDKKSLDQLYRVVKPDGYLILSIPNFLKLSLFFDPYYYLVRIFTVIWEKIKNGNVNISDQGAINEYRRYFGWRLNDLCLSADFQIERIINIGFGPITFWRKEFIPQSCSYRFSNLCEKLSDMKSLKFLRNFTNHWVICLKKNVN